jgi:methylated-DNA-[protein]-cysteine S-methyltransferase
MKIADEVFKIVKKIPKGKVVTYNFISKKINSSPRAVGKILNKNPNLVIVPCHRVVMSNGKIGGYKKGIMEKSRLLKKEGIDLNRLLDYLIYF